MAQSDPIIDGFHERKNTPSPLLQNSPGVYKDKKLSPHLQSNCEAIEGISTATLWLTVVMGDRTAFKSQIALQQSAGLRESAGDLRSWLKPAAMTFTRVLPTAS